MSKDNKIVLDVDFSKANLSEELKHVNHNLLKINGKELSNIIISMIDPMLDLDYEKNTIDDLIKYLYKHDEITTTINKNTFVK